MQPIYTRLIKCINHRSSTHIHQRYVLPLTEVTFAKRRKSDIEKNTANEETSKLFWKKKKNTFGGAKEGPKNVEK